MPIQRWTDVAVPVDKAYDAWTKFDEFPKFMHRVLSVERKGNDRLSWQEKIWFSRRQWEGRITERRKNELIAWKTTSGMSHKGVVSFHPISERLTRVMVTMELEPTGMIEKMASGLRFVKRAVQADLARFKAYVELGDAKGIDYRPNDADEPQSREREEQRRNDGEREADRDERGKRRQARREKSGAG
ncbi:MAG: SRPBCC family protein [Actinobacteria bacterium]|nr:MAG: SRPBCC family protein [Actinomycetota bacterium]